MKINIGKMENMKPKKKRVKRAYALSSTMALVFLLTVLLGVVVAHIEYSLDITNAYLERVQARSELASMTNLALKWLSGTFAAGTRPEAAARQNMSENLTDSNSLSIFSSYNVKEDLEGRVEVFDLDYDPGSLAEPMADPARFPPSLPGGYMIRATVARKGRVSLMTESVYVTECYDVPEAGEVYVLRKEPLYWRESIR
jgi:hypothetical protein